MELVERLRNLVEEELRDTEYFVVDIIGGDKSRKISVLLDGDEGITVEKCSQVSRSISKVIDEESFEADSFILEVSSPGADKPLLKPRQYQKHLGRELEVIKLSGDVINGTLNQLTDAGIQLIPIVKRDNTRPGKGRSSKITIDKTPVDILFEEIDTSTVAISFK
jgi:ribosome maturation factor RimP